MSVTTVTRPRYEIREGLTASEGCPFIEGLVDGVGAVIALRLSQPAEPQWILSTYVEVAAAAGTRHPIAARICDEDQARQWVELLTALYAKATGGEPVDVLLDPVASVRALADDRPREVGNSSCLSDLIDTEVGS